LYREQGLSEEAIDEERVTIYMVGSLQLHSPIKLVDVEEMGEQIRFQRNGVDYIYFLEMTIVLEFLEDLPAQYSATRAIAERLLHYAIYDA
jgi:hypothetical protein